MWIVCEWKCLDSNRWAFGVGAVLAEGLNESVTIGTSNIRVVAETISLATSHSSIVTMSMNSLGFLFDGWVGDTLLLIGSLPRTYRRYLLPTNEGRNTSLIRCRCTLSRYDYLNSSSSILIDSAGLGLDRNYPRPKLLLKDQNHHATP